MHTNGGFMKVLIIDRDDLSGPRIKEKIEALGHQVDLEPVKNNAVDLASREDYRLVFLDPAPLSNARPLILSLRRALRNYSYLVLTSSENDFTDFAQTGANAFLQKPFADEALSDVTESGVRLINILEGLGDDSLDFPSAGGVIAKSAFNQLFLSGIDRADRYNEQTFVVFITVDNYFDMLEKDGPYHADYAVATVSQHLSQIRRQSDIVGQVGKNEYGLLLQRPQYETEPVDAANRFAEELSKLESIKKSVESDPEIRIRLIELPTAKLIADHHIKIEA